jgi:hypothetical protein
MPCPMSDSCRRLRGSECLHLQSQAAQVRVAAVSKISAFSGPHSDTEEGSSILRRSAMFSSPILGLLDVLRGGNTLPQSDGNHLPVDVE